MKGRTASLNALGRSLPPLQRMVFVERPNRFVIVCRSADGTVVRAHVANPGRMHELLAPGVPLLVACAAERERLRAGASRRARSGALSRSTSHDVIAVERDGFPVFLDTHATNDVVATLLAADAIPGLAGASVLGREVTVGSSRFDFLIRHRGRDVLLEVKSCTLFGAGTAMFPDAITERGRRHLLELADLARRGQLTAVLFAIHSPTVRWFMPDYHTDPAFSATLLDVRRDVTILPIAIPWTADLKLAPPARRVPIPWAHLEREIADRGSYLLLMRLERRSEFDVGSLGRRRFEAGWYVYVGSAMQNLSARLARHLRRNGKRFHWHVDHLRAVASEVVPLAIRSSRREECRLATAVSRLYPAVVSGFGSSDCRCRGHLTYSPTPPLSHAAFHRLLESFRMKVRRPGTG